MSTSTNADIVKLFTWAAAVQTAKDESFFVVRAYQTAVETIKNLDEELSVIYKRQGNLDNLPGLGKELKSKALDILTLGHSPALDALFATVPGGMFALLDIPGIGPKRAFKLAEMFALIDPKSAVKDLSSAVASGKLEGIPGYGPKLIANIRENLKRTKPKSDTRLRLDLAKNVAQKAISFLKGIEGIDDIQLLGSIRRGTDTVGDVDLAIITKNSTRVTAGIKTKKDELESLDASGENSIRIRFPGNKQVDIKYIQSDAAGATLQHFTGSKLHNIALRELALSQGMSLSEWGIKTNGKLKPYQKEADFYQALGLDFIPPELRENTGEIEAAQTGKLPHLIELKDIKGDLHTHTDYGWISSHDYGAPVPQILDQAQTLSYDWIALGDHNPSQVSYVKDVHERIVLERKQYFEHKIDSWKKRVKKNTLNVLTTLEIDILVDGSLALSDDALSHLDFAIVSIHSSLGLDTDAQTKRLLRALEHPKVKIIGHPTGRLINERASMHLNWPVIFKTCAVKGIALEINANPHRLDLPDSLVRQAIAAGCKLSLGTDAHQASGLNDMLYGITVARRGWAQKNDIINTYSYNQLIAWTKGERV